MKNQFQKQSPFKRISILWAGALLLVCAMALALFVQTAAASPALQQVTLTPTVTRTPTVTATGGTPSGTKTVTPTPTRINTLPAPYGTSTQLVPVTGADLTQSGGGPGVGVWIALWLLGLLLIIYGLRLKLQKK